MTPLFLCLCFLTGVSWAVLIHQSPPAVLAEIGAKVHLLCSHSRSDLRVMLWYRRKPGDTALDLIGYGYNEFNDGSVEKPFKEDFKLEGDLKSNEKNGSLFITNAQAENHTATYYCAAREDNSGASEAFFGGGTKLTVLEKDHEVTPPKVEVFPPSENERKAKTLVCVASDFYPDHVTVFWKVNEESRTKGNSTDSAAQRTGKKYTISSRLRVDVTEWTSPENSFTCIVRFFNGTTYIDEKNTVNGIKGKEGGLTREKYLRITQNAKLSYVVFIVKSVVYGLFVVFLVWKIQRLNGKQT